MSAKAELAELRKRFDELTKALDLVFERDQYSAWRKAKAAAASGTTQPDDVVVGKNMPAAPIRTELNNIGGATV